MLCRSHVRCVSQSLTALTLLMVNSWLVISPAMAQSPTSGNTPTNAAEPAPPSDPGWPRTFTKAGTTLTIYQPQVDGWKDYEKIKFRCALEVQLSGTTDPSYGVVAVQADTSVDEDNSQVYITNMKVVALRFPGASDSEAAALKAVVLDMLPNKPMLELSLSRVTAYMHDQPKPKAVNVNLNPPPIYFSDSPEVLVTYIGEPQFKPEDKTGLLFAVNTNWAVLMDTKTTQYYLLVGDGWMTAPDAVKGPWTPVTNLPADFSELPKTDQWKELEKSIPAQPMKTVPKVICTTEPAELIVTNGAPNYSPIDGTTLMYVSNPALPVFWDLTNMNYYYLVAGRWFSAPSLNGPWSAASANLPAEFAKIPAESPMGFVLPSVPGTVQATDAVMLAQIPHKATITIATAKVDVAYDGTPKFVVIDGTPMKYAINTGYQVIEADGKYYCCYNAVWFVSPTPTGAWVAATSVPAVIYTIPPSSPVYNCTYVMCYSSTPTTVVYGYTSGYSGAYVAATGALMFGAGMLVGAAIANNNCCWYGYHPCYYSYGCAPYYHYGYCGYYSAGYHYYGPYGGAGYHAGYNPSTGTYYRGGSYSSGGTTHWGGQAYNPWTNTYAQHTGGTNGYKSWGNSYVQQGNQWAQAGHESTARGSAGYADNSSGQWAEGAHSNVTNSSVAKTSSGNMYAGHDGNVYKNTGDGWEKYDGGGNWNQVQKPNSNTNSSNLQQHSQSLASSSQNEWKNNWSGSNNLQNNWDNHSSSSGWGSSWSDHDNQNSLNRDSWSRNYGNGGSSGWDSGSHSWGGSSSGWGGGGSRSWGGGGGGGGWGGGGGRSWGGGGFHGRR